MSDEAVSATPGYRASVYTVEQVRLHVPGVSILICERCGTVVGNVESHDRWHLEHDL